MPISSRREESESVGGVMARGECTAAWSCATGGLVRRTWVTVAGRIGARRHDSRDGPRGAVPKGRGDQPACEPRLEGTGRVLHRTPLGDFVWMRRGDRSHLVTISPWPP